jgi:hypothetical protein
MKLCPTFLFAKHFFGYFQASKKNLPTALELNWQTKETVTKLLRNAPGGGKIPLFRRAGAEN